MNYELLGEIVGEILATIVFFGLGYYFFKSIFSKKEAQKVET